MPGKDNVIYCPEGYDEYCINDDEVPCPYYLDGQCSKEDGILRNAVKVENKNDVV